MGSVKFKDQYMNDKIENQISEIILLSQIAKSEPPAAYRCFVSGYKHNFTFCMKITSRNPHDCFKDYIMSY